MRNGENSQEMEGGRGKVGRGENGWSILRKDGLNSWPYIFYHEDEKQAPKLPLVCFVEHRKNENEERKHHHLLNPAHNHPSPRTKDAERKDLRRTR
jgi:hypothetical protein